MKKSFRSMLEKIIRLAAAGTNGAWIMLPLLPLALAAQWSNDPKVNTPVCVAPGTQSNPVVAGDGAGGAYIAWTDYRGTRPQVYLQRLDAEGYAQWNVNGIPVYPQDSSQLSRCHRFQDDWGSLSWFCLPVFRRAHTTA